MSDLFPEHCRELLEQTEVDRDAAVRERDSLHLELEASKHTHRKDNEHLIRERDQARKALRDARRELVSIGQWAAHPAEPSDRDWALIVKECEQSVTRIDAALTGEGT